MSDFAGYVIDESMPSGAAVTQENMGGNNVRTTWTGSPTKSMAILWFAVLALYWGLGYMFRKQR